MIHAYLSERVLAKLRALLPDLRIHEVAIDPYEAGVRASVIVKANKGRTKQIATAVCPRDVKPKDAVNGLVGYLVKTLRYPKL